MSGWKQTEPFTSKELDYILDVLGFYEGEMGTPPENDEFAAHHSIARKIVEDDPS